MNLQESAVLFCHDLLITHLLADNARRFQDPNQYLLDVQDAMLARLPELTAVKEQPAEFRYVAAQRLITQFGNAQLLVELLRKD